MSALSRVLRTALSRMHLASCTNVGARPSIDGAPHIVVLGRLIIGDDFLLRSRPVQSHVVVGRGAQVRIGNAVQIGAGAAISCQSRIDIEDGVRLGAFCMIMDSDFHVAGDSETIPEPKPIVIGADTRVGHRVVVLPGAQIGAGAIIASGSVVSGEVPAGASVSGNPARIRLDAFDAGEGTGVPELVRSVLALSELPSLDDGPNQIHEWDSLGALRLVLALEEHFAITLTEDEIRSARSIADVERAVTAAQQRRTQASSALTGA